MLGEGYSGGTLNGLAVTNGYDRFLRRTNLALNTQAATLTQFGYDNAGRLQSVTNGNYTASYSYLANSPLVSQISLKSNSVTRMTTTKSYDFLNRLTQISSVPSGAGVPPVSFSYTYNSANQRTRATLADGSYWLYEYDALGQVKSGKKYWYDGTPVAGQQFEYGFDDIGNRENTKAGGDENGANLRLANYTNNSLNQITGRGVPGYVDIMGISFATNTVTVNSQTAYRKGEYFRKELAVNNSSAPLWTNIIVAATGQTSVTGNVLLAKSAEVFTYDSDGNLTSDGLWTNTWNGENRLIKTESLSSVPTAARAREEWTYLPDGRWIQRIVSTNNGSSYYPAYTNRYVWARHVLLAILDHTNGLVMSFMRGLDLPGSLQGAGGVGGVLAVNFKTNGTHFCAYDGNGNVAGLVSGTDGSESARYEYGPFAEPVRVTGPVAKLNPIRFSTQYADDVTGDVKYLFRDYDPECGRWLSRDPIGERAEKGGKNLYCFVGNIPNMRYDRLGLFGNPVSGPNGPVGPSYWSWSNCPRICGPDYTAAVNAEISALRNYLDHATDSQISFSDGSLLFNSLNMTLLLSWFRDVVASMDYAKQANETVDSQNPVTGCPSIGCSGTITLCGRCVGSDVPGNIMFGFTAAATGIPLKPIGNKGAAWAEAWDKDGERDIWAILLGDQDADVFPIGAGLYESGSTADICSIIEKLPGHTISNCAPCGYKKGEYARRRPFEFAYPIYYMQYAVP